jgi:alanine dehydrogenase
MPILFSNDEVERLLRMPDLIDELDNAYRDLAGNRAINRRRSDTGIPRADLHANYVFKSMEGGLPRRGVYALRINSDVIQWPEQEGGQRKEKLPVLPGNRWLGLVLLFSIDNGALLAIFPDGILQRLRVGATNGLAVKYMARKAARQVALIGSGWQAGAQALAACAVRPIEMIRVFSPTKLNREAFAQEWSEKLNIPVVAVDSAEKAIMGSDIVMCATNTMTPIVKENWLKPGMHLSCIKRFELSGEAYRRIDRIAIHTRLWNPDFQLLGNGEIPDVAIEREKLKRDGVDWEDQTEIGDVITGAVSGRTSDEEITCFVNNVGLGFQFAAAGSLLLERARQEGIGGMDIPLDWFTQTVHP